MDTKDRSFLKILKEYFSGKSPKDLVRAENGDIILDPQWFYLETEDTIIDGEKFEKYLARALGKLRATTYKDGKKYYGYYDKVIRENLNVEEAIANNNSRRLTAKERYLIKKELKEKLYNNIAKIVLRLFDENGNILDNVKFIITGIDGETSQEICERPHKFYQSSEEQLYRAIVDGLSEGKKTDADLEAFNLPTIRKIMVDMATKFVQNYERMLLQEKKKSEKPDIIKIVLSRNSGKGPTKENKMGAQQSERKNDLIEYNQRRQVLENAGLKQVAEILSEDFEPGMTSVDCEMFTKQVTGVSGIEDGLLVWFEPLEGNHFSRIAFCTQEKIDKIKTEIGEDDTIKALAKHFYCKSHSDFIKETNISTIAHTSMETFERMVDVLVSQNEKMNQGLYKKDNNEPQRQKKREKLFGIGAFKKMIEKVTQEDFQRAEGIMDEILQPEMGKNQKNIGGE